jgi:arabinose-5-phosphate isomerase
MTKPLIKDTKLVAQAKHVLAIERDAIDALIDRVDEKFELAIEYIMNCKGRVIVTGIGKSGIVAKKIAATLTSTGTSAIFMHPAEGVHGDLGMVLKDDVIICISKSGNTNEITRLFPVFKQIGVPIITLTGNLRSALAAKSDTVLDVSVKEEACPNDLAPTASTTAALAMGDAIAIALLQKRQFNSKDFAFLHPGGYLGSILLRVDDIMFTGDKIPFVHQNTTLRDVILEITKKRFGGTCVVDDKNRLVGIITDGDLRRLWQQASHPRNLCARDIMNSHPKTINSESSAQTAMKLMEKHNILQLVVVDKKGHPIGMIHIHDLLEAGIRENKDERLLPDF